MNIVALRNVLNQTPADYASAPLDAYKPLVEQCEQLQQLAKTVREFVEQVNELRYAEAARQARLTEGRDFGIVRVIDPSDQNETVVCDQRKIIDWDQAQLTALATKITAAGDDPAQYMDVTLKVPESKYAAWPKALREQFEPARTVRPGKASYRLASIDTKK